MYSGKAVAAGISGRAKLIPDITPENMATGMLTQWSSIEVGGYQITSTTNYLHIVKVLQMFPRIRFSLEIF